MVRVLSISPSKLRKTKMERVVALLSQVMHDPFSLLICTLTGNDADTGIGMSPEELKTNLVRLICILHSGSLDRIHSRELWQSRERLTSLPRLKVRTLPPLEISLVLLVLAFTVVSSLPIVFKWPPYLQSLL